MSLEEFVIDCNVKGITLFLILNNLQSGVFYDSIKPYLLTQRYISLKDLQTYISNGKHSFECNTEGASKIYKCKVMFKDRGYFGWNDLEITDVRIRIKGLESQITTMKQLLKQTEKNES